MFPAILNKIKEHKFVLIIFTILFLIPFFWLKLGEMDLGGDANRLYFYDPVSFIKSTALYDISGEGKGVIEPKYFYLPYVSLIALLKSVFYSPTIVITIFNGIKLAVGFIAMYSIVFELLAWGEKNKRNIIRASILSGIFYIVSFGSFNMAFFWDRALFTHDQIFLNPLIFYLLLKFFLTYKYNYLWFILLISFIFSTNFSLLGSAPPMFAFYPLSLLFLFFYVKFFLKKIILWKKVFAGALFFLGIHAFHLFGEIVSFFDKGSVANSLVSSKAEIEAQGVGYFTAVHQHGKAIINLLIPSEKQFLQWISLLTPFILIVGFLLDKGKKKKSLLISLFFVITFFLVTANVTDIGFEFYKKLFYIPGFAMFRNFYTQWMYIFIFFYSLLLGFSIYSIFLRLRPHYGKIFYFLVFFIFIITGIPLFSGSLVNGSIIRASNNVKTTFIMDPKYDQTLKFIRSLPDDGKIMALPLTDNFRQVIVGIDGGAYEGPSTILHLTNKYSFVGYQHFGYKNNGLYAEDIMRYSREKNYDKLLSIFTVLNIKYILHDTDPNAYEKGFLPGSYGYMMTSLPKTQEEYKDFLTHFPLKQIYKNGPYVIYEIDKNSYNPMIFVPDGVYKSDVLSFDRDKVHAVFIDNKTCVNPEFGNLCSGEYKKPNIDIKMRMINPTLYEADVNQNEKIDKLLLVMQNSFHSGWRVIIDGKTLADNSHILVNGYANGWIINSKDLPKSKSYNVTIQLAPQKYFWYGWAITSVSLILVINLLIFSFKKHEKN